MNNINQNEEFQWIWEFRRGDNDGDTSDDLVLHENDEGTITATCQKLDDASNIVEAVTTAKKTKARPNKTKKSNERKMTKAKKSVPMKRRKVTRKSSVEHAQMFEDLKIFASSLIDELKVAREQMFAQMKEEMDKLVESRPTRTSVVLADNMISVVMADNSTSPIQKGTDSSLQPQNHPGGEKGTKRAVASDVHANSQSIEVASTGGRLPMKGPMNVESKKVHQFAQHLNLPTFVPTPQVQSRHNGIHLDGDNSVGAPRVSYHGVPAFHPEVFQSFHQLIPKGVGFSYQNNSPLSSKGVDFLTPVPQGLGIGSSMSGSSSIPTQYYSGSLPLTQSRAAAPLMMNPMFLGGSVSSSNAVSRSYLSNNVLQRNGGDHAQSKSQLMNDSQFFPRFLFDK